MLIKEPWLIQNTDFLQNNIYKKKTISETQLTTDGINMSLLCV